MAVESYTYAEARELTLAYYIQRRDAMGLPMRDMPFKKVETVVLSINSIIANIESNTDIGQWLVAEYADSMEWVILV